MLCWTNQLLFDHWSSNAGQVLDEAFWHCRHGFKSQHCLGVVVVKFYAPASIAFKSTKFIMKIRHWVQFFHLSATFQLVEKNLMAFTSSICLCWISPRVSKPWDLGRRRTKVSGEFLLSFEIWTESLKTKNFLENRCYFEKKSNFWSSFISFVKINIQFIFAAFVHVKPFFAQSCTPKHLFI